MEQLRVYRESSNRINWKPSPIVSLATSIDGSQVAAAREDGSLEIWLVSPGSVGWHCQLRIHGNTSPKSRITSLVWCYSGSKSTPCGRLLSSSTDGTISEWDFFNLEQKIVLDINGVSIWQMATEPFDESILSRQHDSQHAVNGYRNDNSTGQNYHETSDSEDGDDEDDDSVNLHLQSIFQNQRVAVGCDDGSVRVCNISDADGVTYKLLSKVDGRVLSVAWSHDARQIFSGSSDGFIRCWDAELGHEVYRITVGLGGLGNGRSVCTWSLLSLRCGTLVSADSSGSVQFWNSKHGSRLQAHSYHKGDVYALAASPSHTRVFSAGSDGQVILYKCSVGASSEENSPEEATKWVYVSCVRAHTHDIMALTVAVPICREELVAAPLLGKRKKRTRQHEKPLDFSYHKWAHLGVPMLISGGDDTKLFAYSIREFTKFSPHDICPAPQRVPIQLAPSTNVDGVPLLLVQCSNWLDIFYVHINSGAIPYRGSQKNATTKLLTRIESEASRKIICSTMSNTGVLFAYSDNVKPSLFQLKRSKKNSWAVYERELPRALPFAHSMVFSSDSSRLMISSQDRKIYVVDVETAELLHMFTPCRKDVDGNLPSRDPPITKMFTSLDGQWLAAINCFGDIYIFNLETERQHWFISRLNGSSVTAGGFPPGNNNVLIVTTSSNHVYAFDVEAKQLGEWSREHTFVLPRRFQEFPGEVIGLSFSPVSGSTSIIVYSARAMCLIDFGMPVNRDDDDKLTNGHVSPPTNKKLMRKQRNNKNFDFCDFRDPVLFVSHTSENSVLVVDKPWMEVMKTFVAPVHRHVYGRS